MANAPIETVSAQGALARLKAGNAAYRSARANDGDISPERRHETAEGGQRPYAAVVACADSRTAPEHAFMAGVGELFTVRVAGNSVGPVERASVVYAVRELGARLVVVLGHTRCGAVAAAISGAEDESLAAFVDPVRAAIGDERDERAACARNVEAGVRALEACPEIVALEGVRVVGGVYDVATGAVEFLEDEPSRAWSPAVRSFCG